VTLQLVNHEVKVGSKATDLPALASFREFTFAVVYTIIPALADNVPAIMEWCTLVASVAQLDKSKGWAAAYAYLKIALSGAVYRGESIAKVLPQHLTAVFYPSAAPASGATRPSAPASAPASGRSNLCNNWNRGVACMHSPCLWQHKCNQCGQDHVAHSVHGVPRQGSIARPRRTRAGASKGVPSQSAASVHTAAPAASPSKSGAGGPTSQ
jgi:hypothetical protein